MGSVLPSTGRLRLGLWLLVLSFLPLRPAGVTLPFSVWQSIKYRAFGWNVNRINGYDMEQVVEALEQAKASVNDSRSGAICTCQGVSAEVEKKLEAKMPKFSRDYVLSVVEADGC